MSSLKELMRAVVSILVQMRSSMKAKTAKERRLKEKLIRQFSVTLHAASEERERFISFVNSTPTFDGGFHHDRVRRVFVNHIKEKLTRQAKKEKVVLNDNDILCGLTFIIGVTMPNPRFESQIKESLSEMLT